ncbi:MAG TPA: hypothetical protein ENJ09_06605 [Planctomycetes bacterium]|nr:hypothetical protein [Planctomycetota bacterium]
MTIRAVRRRLAAVTNRLSSWAILIAAPLSVLATAICLCAHPGGEEHGHADVAEHHAEAPLDDHGAAEEHGEDGEHGHHQDDPHSCDCTTVLAIGDTAAAQLAEVSISFLGGPSWMGARFSTLDLVRGVERPPTQRRGIQENRPPPRTRLTCVIRC